MTQIRVIGSMEVKICTKMLRNVSEKREAEFPATTFSFSVVKTAHLDDAFSEVFNLEVSPVEGQSRTQKDKRRRKKKSEIKDI